MLTNETPGNCVGTVRHGSASVRMSTRAGKFWLALLPYVFLQLNQDRVSGLHE